MTERWLSIEGIVQIKTNKDTYTKEFESLEELRDWFQEVWGVGWPTEY